MNILKTCIEKGEIVTTAASWVSGALLFATALMIAVEVVLRKAFTISMGGADELSGYAMAISCSWSFAFALYRKAHLRIDVIYMRLSSGLQLFLDILSLALFGIFMTVLSYFASMVLITSIVKHSTANTSLQTPMWIPQSLWLFGLLLFTLTIYVILLGTIAGIRNKEFSPARRISAMTTLDEEIEEGNAASDKYMAELSSGGVR